MVNFRDKYLNNKPHIGILRDKITPNKGYYENRNRQRKNRDRNPDKRRRQDLRFKKIRRSACEGSCLGEQISPDQVKLDQWGACDTPKVWRSIDLVSTPDRNIGDIGNKGFHVETVYIAPGYDYNADVVVKPGNGQKISYGQNWHAYNGAQTQEKYLFLKILHEICSQLKEPKKKKNGRPGKSYAERIYCCCVKTYLNFSSRRTISDLKFAEGAGYIDSVPHFNSILNYLNDPKMKSRLEKLITRSALPLKEVERRFAIDATGFSTYNFERWLDVKNDVMRIRSYKKAHVQCGTKTNVITSIVVDQGYSSDSKMLPYLIKRTAENFIMDEVSADKAYSSRDNLRIIFDNGAVPYIPFKRNSRAKAKGCAIWNAMFNYFKYGNDEFLQHYHLRSNVESTFSMIKRKFGTTLRTKNDVAQANEVLCKALCHNIVVLIHEIFELGIKVDFSEVNSEWNEYGNN